MDEFNSQKDRANAACIERFGKLWFDNAVQNQKRFHNGPFIGTLMWHSKEWEKHDVIVVGAGPSLNGVIDDLREFRDRYKIICVDAAFKPLRKAGIKPDWIYNIDPDHCAENFYTDVDSTKCNLVVPITSSYKAVQKFQGKIIWYRPVPDNQVFQKLDRMYRYVHTFFINSNVTNAAIVLAHHMKFRRIIVVGMDLAFPQNGSYYADGITMAAPSDEVPTHYIEPATDETGTFNVLEISKAVTAGIDFTGKTLINHTFLFNRVVLIEQLRDLKMGNVVNCSLRDFPRLPLTNFRSIWEPAYVRANC